MRRTSLAIALSAGALAIPAVALASGGDTNEPATTPVQNEQQQEQQPRDHDCPEGQAPESGGGNESTQL